LTDPLDEAVGALVREVGRLDEAPAPMARWADVGIDSLDLVELVEAAEARFGVVITDRVAVRLRGPDDLVAAVRRSVAP
jgi:acyl carrier protein